MKLVNKDLYGVVLSSVYVNRKIRFANIIANFLKLIYTAKEKEVKFLLVMGRLIGIGIEHLQNRAFD